MSGRRLRPGVAVTPLREGLHLRGRRGNLTLEGSAALPALWRSLEGPLREGRLEELLDGVDPASPLRGALDTLLGQLEAHDLLLPGGPDVGPGTAPGADPVTEWTGAESVTEWTGADIGPAATAADARAAAGALVAGRAEVLAASPDDPLARAAGRALERGGLSVTYTPDPTLPAHRVLLHARTGTSERGIALGFRGASGYATAPGGAAQVRADARALEARLTGDRGAASGEEATEDEVASEPPEFTGSRASVALLAGAAAHRLLCAVAALPDPAFEGGAGPLPPGLPAVLLADARPPRAAYHTWLGPRRHDPDRRTALDPADTLDSALRRVAALGDERCGPLPLPLPGELRQLPVPLAGCVLPGPGGTVGTLTGGAPRLDLARLEVFCRAAELLLGGAWFTVGADPGHARGRALRRAAAHRPDLLDGRSPVPAERWSGHPQARHWWATLTVRLDVPAHLEVTRSAPGAEVYRAVVRRTGPAAPAGPGALPLGEAVEATPADAAAFACLAAVAAVRAAPDRPVRPSGGAAARLATAGARTAPWEGLGGTGRWLADLAGREEPFQDALLRLTGLTHLPAPRGELADLLTAFGFTVLYAPEEPR
ncbi:hypothetical protein AB0P15_11380 [Streptomyces sp. NPDC087917]|uniref:hypothetical protein n=1 Tax=Streptomyces sp. NPDC087917 TaxID=3155060 RepID=UPI00341E4F43